MSETDVTADILRLLGSMEGNAASDLFLTEGKAPAARVHGQVRPIARAATSRAELDALLARALPGAARERFDGSGDVDVGLSLEDGRRFRLNVARQQGVLSVVARAVPSGALRFDQLQLPDVVRRFAEQPRGIVLVTGSTGSGKSTTLAAMVHHINETRRAHVVTIEDPIEFVHRDRLARITQREVGPDTGSFDAALRHVVRQSPDVILVGEMRDPETMQVAVSAALTGHLVLASVHTIDATQTLQRILAYYAEHLRAQAAMDLSLSLVGIVSQRLLPRRDGNGRVVAVEVLSNTPPVAKLLREQRVTELQELMRSIRGPEMVTFNDSLLDLLHKGLVAYEVAAAHASNADEFALAARGMATGAATFTGSRDDETGTNLDLQAMLHRVVSMGASDLHLAAGRRPLVRLDGALEPLGDRDLTDADMRVLLNSILSARQRSAYEIEREIDFALAIDSGRRFRVNAYYQKGRMCAAMRSIAAKVPEADALGIPTRLLELGAKPQGLLLVVGPTGVGKSTTLACLVDRVNRTRACRIITIEDPIEYVHTGIKATVDQREVFVDTKSFSAALKYVLRQDPDVILVGEMRDLETVSAVLTAAETGHLVFATLHTNDAAQAVDRMIDLFPAHQQVQARIQLSACLLGVASQRLLPRKDGRGLVAVFELMVATTAIRTLIRESKMHQAVGTMEASRKEGCITMDQALKEAIDAGRITIETATAHASNAKNLFAPAPAPDAAKGRAWPR